MGPMGEMDFMEVLMKNEESKSVPIMSGQPQLILFVIYSLKQLFLVMLVLIFVG